MSLAIVDNSPPSDCGVARHPRPSAHSRRAGGPVQAHSVFRRAAIQVAYEHASRVIYNCTPEGPLQEGPVPAPPLTSRSCAPRHSSPRQRICKARSTPGKRLQAVSTATAAPMGFLRSFRRLASSLAPSWPVSGRTRACWIIRSTTVACRSRLTHGAPTLGGSAAYARGRAGFSARRSAPPSNIERSV